MENILYKKLINSLSEKNMTKVIEYFSNLNRLTGTEDCEKAAKYICEELKSYGVSYENYEFEGYFSNPVKSTLKAYIGDNEINISSKPRSFSLNCPEGLSGDLVYDSKSKGQSLNKKEERDWYSSFRGKIVLSWNFYEDYVKKVESYGAIGIIHIWPTDEMIIHEETVGPIWGTPTLENFQWIPKIPVLGIQKADGLQLIDSISDNDIRIFLQSWIEYRVDLVSLPVAYVPGKLKEYILVSGHYDSWYEGVTDNAVGNAVCLEMARVFNSISDKLERGIKVAFWPGHSNGRYLGSTWFCDNFWNDLNENCIAHINIDSPGSKGAEVIVPRTTKFEGENFTCELIKEFTNLYPEQFAEIPRGADQSFWGVNIPFHIMYKYEPAKNKKIYSCPGSGGGWWWHSEYDSLDKFDVDILIRDTKLNVATAYNLIASSSLPVDFDAYFLKQEETIKYIEQNADSSFDFKPIFNSLSSLKEKVFYIMKKNLSLEKTNAMIKLVGGKLNHLIYSSTDNYDFDNTFPSKPFPGLQQVVNVYKNNATKEEFLFVLTGFVRHRNRIVNELKEIERTLDSLL